MELRDGGVLQTENTSELIKMIRRASEALDKAMAVANVDYFAPHLETLRTDILELFRRLLIRNPYSSYRKDVASKMWFRTIYPSIEQYRANIKQFETMLGWPAASRGSQQQGSSDGSTGADAIAVRRELSKWRARFQRFLQASSGSLLRVVAELAESNELAAARSLSRLSDFATDYRALAVHAYGFEFVDGLRSELHPTLKPVQRAALAIISRLLIYLGDLSRYRILYTSKKQSIAGMVRAVSSGQPQQHKSLAGAAAAAAAASAAAAAEASSVSLSSPSLAVAHHDLWWPAKNFYRGASRLAPHRGQAYNQLAVVHGYEKNSLDGIFCYYRALTALISFMPAEANLKTILDNAVRAIDDGDNKGGDASDLGVHTGYLYYEHKVYQKFTHLRCLFAMYQPTARERADLLATGKLAERLVITPDLERQLFSDIGTASARFVHGVKTGSVSLRHALVAQGIHIFELQRLSALSTDDSEVALHSLAVTRLSAHLAMGVAQGLCAFVAASITDALRNANRVREVKSEGDLLSKACRRAVPALVQTLVWLVSACVRVVRDSTARDYVVAHGAPVSALRRLVFEAVRDCGLMASVAALRTVMIQARAKVNRRAMGADAADPPALSWPDMVLSESIAPLARQLWPSFGGVASETGEGSLRLEEELFVGWRLPDGTVWGRQSEDGHLETAASASASVEIIDSGSGSSSDEDGFQVRCRQLWCLLHVVSECVPAVESIISGIPASIGAVTPTAVVESKNNSIGGRAAGKRSQEDDDDDDEEVGEEETICFQGRSVPSTGIKQGQQQPHLAASPMMPESIIQSIPPTPDMRQDGRKFFRVQADKQETAEAPVPPTTMMTSLGIGSLATSLSLPPPPPLLATSVSFSGAENTGLVDREKDEVVSPAMIAASSQNRTNARVAAIGSQRLPLGGNAASVSTKLPLSAVSDSHQWPFYSSGPSTAPVSPDAIASGAASVSAGGFYSSPNYPTVIKASAPMSVGETPAAAAAAAVGSGWDTLLPHQQQRQNTPGQTALLAWQQYQIEYQKKQALQQQLDQQQMIQQHLQQQLLVQQKQNPAALFGNNPSFSAPQQQQQFIGGASASGGLDPTTASVLNMAMSMPPSGSAAEDEKPSLLSVYGSYNLPRSTDMISASASALAAATAPVSAPMYPGGTATYSAYSWAMLPSVRQTLSNGSMQYSGQIAQQALSLSSLSSSSLHYQQQQQQQQQQQMQMQQMHGSGSAYLPLQIGASVAATSTTNTAAADAVGGHSRLPYVYGSYGGI